MRKPHASVADAPEDETTLDRLVLLGRHCDQPPVLLLEAVTDELDRLDLPVAVQRHRGGEEAETKRDGLAHRLTSGEAAQHLEISPRVRLAFERRLADRVELELRRIDGDVGTRELAELGEFRRRERRLRE